MKRRSTHALVLLLSLALSASAQQPRAGSAEEGEAARRAAERRAELERKAVALLREAVEDAQSLKLVENRVRTQVLAAALLWPRDEKAARALFKSAADALAAYGSSIDPEEPQFYMTAQSYTQMRTELIQTLGQNDPKLALEYLRSTRTPHAEAMRASGYMHEAQEQQLEMSLAARLAAKEPEGALRMAEESLGRGLSPSLVEVLQALRAKDPAAASRLASGIVARLRAEDLLTKYEAGAVALQLLSLAQTEPPAAQVLDGAAVALVRPASTGQAPPLLDARTRAALVEKVLAAATSNGPNQAGTYNIHSALQLVLPDVEKVNPARAEALRRRSNVLERAINPQADAWRQFREVSEKGSVDDVLEAAPKAPPEIRDQLYTQAVWKALNEGDAERARKLLDNISNPQQRAQMRKSIEVQLQWRAAQEGKFAEARAAVARLTTAEEKIAGLTQVAGTALAKGEAGEARAALDEAVALSSSLPAAGAQQFNARLQLAGAFAQLDAGAGFELVESSIARLNELLDAAAALEGFGQDSFRDGELRGPQQGYVWNDLITRCAGALAALAPSDFERASAAAKSFRRTDARAAAELQLAQSVLNSLRQGQPTEYRGLRRTTLTPLNRVGGIDYLRR